MHGCLPLNKNLTLQCGGREGSTLLAASTAGLQDQPLPWGSQLRQDIEAQAGAGGG